MQIMRACVHPSVAVTRKQAFECVVLLKIGSWSFECIIILLIYFLNCWKALFKRQKVSFNKKHRVKSVRLALLRWIPSLCTPVSAIFVCVPKCVGGKKGNRTEPNRTTELYRKEPRKISDCCGTGFYLRHRTEPTNVIFILSLFLSILLN